MSDNTNRIELAQLRRLEVASLVEGTTLLLLLAIAVPLKHLFDLPEAVRIIGPVHGLAFLAYMWTALQTISGSDWSRGDVVRVMVGAFVPFGAFFNSRLVNRKMTTLRATNNE